MLDSGTVEHDIVVVEHDGGIVRHDFTSSEQDFGDVAVDDGSAEDDGGIVVQGVNNLQSDRNFKRLSHIALFYMYQIDTACRNLENSFI